jgi:hypothetical protein
MTYRLPNSRKSNFATEPFSEQWGHTSIKITVDIYGHPRQGTNMTNIMLADQLDSVSGKALGWDTQRSATSAQLDNPPLSGRVEKSAR